MSVCPEFHDTHISLKTSNIALMVALEENITNVCTKCHSNPPKVDERYFGQTVTTATPLALLKKERNYFRKKFSSI